MKKPEFIRMSFYIYLLKCIIGVSICYIFYQLFQEYRLYWSMISVLLVISEDDLECKRLPISRIKANMIGSLIGFILFVIHPLNLLITWIGVVLTILTCYIFKLGAATRSALAALIIVLVQQTSDATPLSAFERVGSVVLGSIVALLITEITNRTIVLVNKHIKNKK